VIAKYITSRKAVGDDEEGSCNEEVDGSDDKEDVG
jgi:hypothetical protein